VLIPDLNLLVYAFNSDASHHRPSAQWWEDSLNGDERIGVPWLVLMGFIRLLSGKAVMKNPYPVKDLFQITKEWFQLPNVILLEPTVRTYDLMEKLMVSMSLPGSMATDTFIAATAIEHDASLCTNDTDFSRFHSLKTLNPLIR
jgi:uncharacterized protein